MGTVTSYTAAKIDEIINSHNHGNTVPSEHLTNKSAHDEIIPWADVVSSSAVGDGVTDDTDVLNTFIAINRFVRFTSGTYKVGELVIPANTTILMDRGAKFVAKVFTSAGPVISLRGNDIILDGVKVDGNRANQTIGNIDLVRSDAIITRLTIRNGEFYNGNAYGLVSRSFAVTDLTIVNNYIHDLNAYGITYQAGTTRAFVSNNYIKDAIGNGIQFFHASVEANFDLVISENIIEGATICPIEIQRGRRAVIANNVCRLGGANGISSGTCSEQTIVGNVIEDQTKWGLEIQGDFGGNDITVTGNMVRNCGIGAVINPGSLGEMTNVIFSDNVLENLTSTDATLGYGRGIVVFGAKGVIVSNNTVINPLAEAILVGPKLGAGSGLAGAEDVMVTGNFIKFTTARRADLGLAPIGIRVTESKRTSVIGNHIMTAVDLSAVSNRGPITVTGNPVDDCVIIDNICVATTAAAALNTGISVGQAGTVVDGIHVGRNIIRNFNQGIATALGGTLSNVRVFSNRTEECPTPYAVSTGHSLDLFERNAQVDGDFTATGNLAHTGVALGFFGKTPTSKRGLTDDLKQTLVDYGLLTGGGNTPLNLGGSLTANNGIFNGTQVSINGVGARLRLGDGVNATFISTLAGSPEIRVEPNAVELLRLSSAALTMTEGKNIAVGATTGTKIGTAAAQKLGFFGATPIAQPAANPDTTNALLSDLEIEINQIKALLRSLGLMAT